ncbi:MAG: septum formation protein Maf [Christensenellaceae bacterium]|nr:septum formation protein Maf [Christensenellaceae bacterium]
MSRIILASASPRRKELLGLITPDFQVKVSQADETTHQTDPACIVRELAYKKAAAVAAENPDHWVIGSDTVVWCRGKLLGKPTDRADARRMMRLLAGGEHQVYTGICVISPEQTCKEACCTAVHFSDITDEQLEAYLDEMDWTDKAGGYGIQGAAAKFVTGIEGCYYNVMGLPVQQLYALLMKMGCPAI